jgi:hypothetical protein
MIPVGHLSSASLSSTSFGEINPLEGQSYEEIAEIRAPLRVLNNEVVKMNDFTAEFEPERFEHLTPQTALLLNAPLATRLAAIDEDIFIAWDGAENVLDALEHRYSMPSGPRRRCLLLIAMPGQGKTWVHREFLRRHQIDQETLLAKDGSRPVLLLSLASVSSEEDFLVRLISTLGSHAPTEDARDEG